MTNLSNSPSRSRIGLDELSSVFNKQESSNNFLSKTLNRMEGSASTINRVLQQSYDMVIEEKFPNFSLSNSRRKLMLKNIESENLKLLNKFERVKSSIPQRQAMEKDYSRHRKLLEMVSQYPVISQRDLSSRSRDRVPNPDTEQSTQPTGTEKITKQV